MQSGIIIIGLRFWGQKPSSCPDIQPVSQSLKYAKAKFFQMEGTAGTQALSRNSLVSSRSNKSFDFWGYPRDFKDMIRKGLSFPDNSGVGAMYSRHFI